MKFLKPFLGAIGLMLVALTITACGPAETSAADQARKANVAAQNDVIGRATAQVPVPRSENFLARENLAEYMRRMDDPAKTWYIYELGDNGSAIGYYVSQSYPQSICTFMTPPEEVRVVERVAGGPDSFAVTTAPALDGIYYKGGGCETKFFFDLSSGAIILTEMRVRTSDVPLSIDAPMITVVKNE